MKAWKPIAEAPGYFISNNGDVVSIKRKSYHPISSLVVTWKNRKRETVRLRCNGKNKQFFVHRLVARAFVPGYDPSLSVNHKDGNSLNNQAANLEWMTLADNIRDAWKNGHIGNHPNYFRKGESYLIRHRSKNVTR